VVGCVVSVVSTKAATHSGILFVSPIDWVAPKAVYTLAARKRASRLGTGLRFGQAGSVGDDGLVCVGGCGGCGWMWVWVGGRVLQVLQVIPVRRASFEPLLAVQTEQAAANSNNVKQSYLPNL
jgi:hypothetical protein